MADPAPPLDGELARTIAELQATISIAEAIGAETDVRAVRELIVERGRVLVGARAALIAVRRGSDAVVVAASRAQEALLGGRAVSLEDSAVGRVLGSTEPLAVPDVATDPAVSPAERDLYGARGALFVPLRFRASTLAALVVLDRADGAAFDAGDRSLLVSFARASGIALETARRASRVALRRALEAEENERRRLARELHDETGQMLNAALLALGRAEAAGDGGERATALARARELVTATLRSVRELMTALRPSALDELGLVPALERLIDRFHVAGSGEIRLAVGAGMADGGERLHPEVETAVYRVTQEALTNIVKHAGARKVTVAIEASGGLVRLSVTDDGAGFVPGVSGEGLGFVGMRERLSLLGGELAVRTAPGRGTALAATIPTLQGPVEAPGGPLGAGDGDELPHDSAQVWLWSADPQGLVTFVSRGLTEFTGLTAEQVRADGGAGWVGLVHPDDRERVRRGFEGAVALRRPFKLEYRIRIAAGDYRWVLDVGEPHFDEHGALAGYIGCSSDLTARKRSDDELRERADLFGRVSETMREGIWILDAADRTAFVSDTMAELLGYEPEEMLGRTPLDFVEPEDRPESAARLERRRRGIGDQSEVRLRRKDGSHLWMVVSGAPLTDAEGGHSGSFALFTDISYPRQAREELEARFRAVFETAPDGIVITDDDRRYLDANPAACDLLDRSLDELIGLRIDDILAPERRAVVDESWRDHLERAGWALRESRIQRPDGTLRDIELSTTSNFLPGRHLGLMRDVTERKRAEAAVRRQALVFQSISDAALVTDLDGRVVDCNPAAERMFGYAREELVGRPAGTLDAAGGHRPPEPGDGHAEGQAPYRRKDGTTGLREYRLIALRDERGELSGLLELSRDLEPTSPPPAAPSATRTAPAPGVR